MDQTIIDVVLGLILIYLCLALLATKVQETLQGGVFARRTGNLHSLLFEAVGGDSSMRNKLLANPLISSLYKGTTAKSGIFSSGPSAIPPPLFARALLMELNGGEHPSIKFGTPQTFIESTTTSATLPPAMATVRALVPGRETNWSALEQALAQWFNDIGDRSEGWYTRESSRWSIGIALFLAASLNADSGYIANQLSTDPDLRRGLADIAERVQALRETESGLDSNKRTGASSNPVTVPTEVQASKALGTAIGELSKVFFKDREISRFNIDYTPNINENCPPNKKEGDNKKRTTAEIWMRVLPDVLAQVDNANIKSSDKKREELIGAHSCLASIIGWVQSATPLAADEAGQRRMQDTAAALITAKDTLAMMIAHAPSTLAYSHLFRLDPLTFKECHETSPTSRAAFEDCLARARAQSVWLPVGWSGANIRQQFCKVTSLRDDTKTAPPSPSWPCSWGDEARIDQQDKNLGIPRMYLVSRDQALLDWLAGILVTALFVALGAPFWFDLLGKFIKMRVAGKVREDSNAPQPNAGQPQPGPTDNAPPANEKQPGFSDAHNRFEDALTAADIVRLQQARNISATSRLDGPTRRSIAAFCSEQGIPVTEELDLLLYERIVGRTPTGSPLQRASGIQLGSIDSRIEGLVASLEKQLDMEGRTAAIAGRVRNTFDADARALAVLYRYKTDPQTKTMARRVFDLARTDPAELDYVSDSLAAAITGAAGATPNTQSRESAPWLDWAIGELGQVEKGGNTHTTSNPRICQYLDAGQSNGGDSGDNKPWCGGYVAWVVTRFNEECARRAQTPGTSSFKPLANIPASALTAIGWQSWGNSFNLRDARPGDVVIVQTNPVGPKHHVGFAFDFEKDSTGTPVTVQLLGGNQSEGSRVCLSRFKAEDVVAVVRG